MKMSSKIAETRTGFAHFVTGFWGIIEEGLRDYGSVRAVLGVISRDSMHVFALPIQVETLRSNILIYI